MSTPVLPKTPDLEKMINQAVKDEWLARRLKLHVKSNHDFDWQDLFDIPAQNMRSKIAAEQERVSIIESAQYKDQALIDTSAVKNNLLLATAVGAVFGAIEVVLFNQNWGLLRHAFDVQGSFTRFLGIITFAGIGIVVFIAMMTMFSQLSRWGQEADYNGKVKSKRREAKRKIKSAGLAGDLDSSEPEKASYKLRAQTSSRTGKMEAVLTFTYPVVVKGARTRFGNVPSQIEMQSKEVIKIPMDSSGSAKAIEDFATLVDMVDAISDDANSSYEQYRQSADFTQLQDTLDKLREEANGQTVDDLIACAATDITEETFGHETDSAVATA